MLSSLFGIFILGSAPLGLLLCIVIICKFPKSFRKCVWLYAITFGMIAYCYEPIQGHSDLTRYFEYLDYCRTVPFSQAFLWAGDGLVVKNFVFWVISRANDNHILPLLSVGIVFWVSGYLYSQTCKNNESMLKNLLFFHLMMMPVYAVLGNVRNISAFSLGILAVYRDLVLKKRNFNTMLLYILPCFIHMTGFVMPALRLSLILMKKYPYFTLISTLGIPSVSIGIYEVTGKLNLPGVMGAIVSRVVWKAWTMTNANSEYAVERHSGGHFQLSLFFMFIVTLCILMMLISQLKDKQSKIYEYKLFVGLLIGITLIWAIFGIVKTWVFFFAVLVSCSPVLYDFKYDNSIKFWQRQFICYSIPLIMCIRYPLEIYHLFQRSLDIHYFWENFIASNFWIVICKMFYNLLS